MNMEHVLPDHIRDSVLRLLSRALASTVDELQHNVAGMTIKPLDGDGSSRTFFRVGTADSTLVVIVPSGADGTSLQEAKAAWHIGRHLFAAGVPVPRLHEFDHQTGILVCEDLGNCHLQDVVVQADFDSENEVRRVRALYRQVLKDLVNMQVAGSRGFEKQWCWDTGIYDRQVMLERESGYFLRAFWLGLLGKDVPPEVHQERMAIADLACRVKSSFFLHRDFQSRNIMVQNGQVRFIDFQGGRLGPLGYDLASVLIDPYVTLPTWLQEELIGYYLDTLSEHAVVDTAGRQEFMTAYPALAIQRNLQIIGAFAYLSSVRNKARFAGYIAPALQALRSRLANSYDLVLPILSGMVEQAITHYAEPVVDVSGHGGS